MLTIFSVLSLFAGIPISPLKLQEPIEEIVIDLFVELPVITSCSPLIKLPVAAMAPSENKWQDAIQGFT